MDLDDEILELMRVQQKPNKKKKRHSSESESEIGQISEVSSQESDPEWEQVKQWKPDMMGDSQDRKRFFLLIQISIHD